MSTKNDLKNQKPKLIRRITKGKTWSVNIPLPLIEQANLSDSDYLYSYVDTKNRLIFEKVKINEECEQ